MGVSGPSSAEKTILITGGCGFVGRHLIKRLAQESAEFWVIDDLSTGMRPECWESPRLSELPEVNYPGVKVYELEETGQRLFFVQADLTTVLYGELGRQARLKGLKLPHFHEAYHLASVVGGRAMIEGNPLAVAIDLSIDSTFMLWASQTRGADRLLYASSSAAYPTELQCEGTALALSEDMLRLGPGMSQPDLTYGWSKLTGEYLAGIAAEKYGLKVAVVRPFSGYGEDQDLSYPVPAIALRVAGRQAPITVWGSGRQGRDFVHIDDCAEACIRACRRIDDGSGVNIGSGTLTTFKDLARRLIELEGYKTEVVGTDGKPVGVAARYCDPTYMKEKLDWEPKISLDEGLMRVLKHAHRRNNALRDLGQGPQNDAELISLGLTGEEFHRKASG